jgi:uncharacterized protein (DUF927 family)
LAKGRKKADIVTLRAWWTDLDDKDAREPFDLARVPLEPSMIVRSGHGMHLYWIAVEPYPFPGDTTRCDLHEAELKRIRAALEPFGADAQVCDVSRVMRLPGFVNRKRAPFPLVELVSAAGAWWDRETILSHFPMVDGQEGQARKAEGPAPLSNQPGRAEVLDRAGRFLDTLPEGIQGQKGSTATYNAALKIMDAFDLAEDEALSLLWDRYNPRCVPPWTLEELRKKVNDAAPHCRDRGHLLREGRQRPGAAAKRDRRANSAGQGTEAKKCPTSSTTLAATADSSSTRTPTGGAGATCSTSQPGATLSRAHSTEPETTADHVPPSGSPEPPEMPPPPVENEGPQEGAPEAAGRPVVRGFEWEARGLVHLKSPGKEDTDGNATPPVRVWIAPPFTLPGLVRDEASQGWRLLIAWHDLDGTPHEEALPFELLNGEGPELARTLAQGGMMLPPDPGLRRHLLRYLCEAARRVRARVRLVEALGWQEGAFVLPDGETIGQTVEPVRFAGELPGLRSKAMRGTLEGWQTGVARFAVGNPRLAFALACAFAGPLLEMVRPDGGGGFNLMGFSSKGKSTCLEAAASVWGRPDPLPTWRATGNGLEGIAATRNDGFLVLDELSQVDPKEAGSVAYMLANGSAKARANREGGARTMRQWRLVFLSSGEQGLEDKMMEDGKRARAGQEVRVPDIPCPSEGMFEEAHGLPGLGALAEHLKAQARKHYGHAARAFLNGLCEEWEHRDALQTKLREMERAWLANALPRRVDAQVHRVAGRFALVAVAGELAQRMAILPWPESYASSAALVCFKAWLDRRGFTGASEVHKGIEAVLSFLEKNGQARFDEYGDKNAHVVNRAGTKKRAEGAVDGWDYYLTTAAWKEACTGFSSASVAKACADAGILELGPDGRHSRTVSIPHHGKPRCYVIRAVAVAELGKDDAA